MLTPALHEPSGTPGRADGPGGVALGATLVSLIITDLVSDGLDITGVGAWLWATLILWGSALLATLLLPYFGLRRFFEKRDDRR